MEQIELNLFENLDDTYSDFRISADQNKRKEEINDFINEMGLPKILLEDDNEDKNKVFSLLNIVNLIDGSLTLIYEAIYVDKLFRDLYYHYYSEKYKDIPRDCNRIFILKGNWNSTIFFNPQMDKNIHDEIQQSLVGFIVIQPLKTAPIGRILLDPFKTNIAQSFLRTTKISCIFMGQKYEIDCYPFSTQDGEYLRCAEISIWTILEYYGTRYSTYRTVLPHEFKNILEAKSNERLSPSQGLYVRDKSWILKKFNLSTRLYTYDSFIDKFTYGDIAFKNVFYSYVQSGFPISMTLDGSTKHAVVCIGHGKPSYEITKETISFFLDDIQFTNASEFIKEYVIMDDFQIPYRLEKFNHFSIDRDSELKMFIVPLYKRIFMDVRTAYVIFQSYIYDCQKEIKEYLNKHSKSKRIVQNIFLTSSRNYRLFKVETAKTHKEKFFYTSLPLSRFVWIMELGTLDQIKENNTVFAEVVLDATINCVNTDSINIKDYMIYNRIGSHIGYVDYDEKSNSNLSKQFFGEIQNGAAFEITFEQFDKNLRSN